MSEFSRAKLRCRRGMKELDVVLDRYLSQHWAMADIQEQQLFSELLDLQDPELFRLLFGLEEVPEQWQALILKIRQV